MVTREMGADEVCRTEAFDDMGPVGEEPRWEIFGEFHAYLDKKFPLM